MMGLHAPDKPHLAATSDDDQDDCMHDDRENDVCNNCGKELESIYPEPETNEDR